MGDGTKENPYTGEDVLRLIEENDGTAKGLDLSGKTFEECIDLSNQILHGIILNDTKLIRTNFNGCDLDDAVMQRANLEGATFNPCEGKAATLAKTDMRGAYLKNAEFREADLSGAQFQEAPETSLCANLEETDFRNANLFGTKFGEKSYFYRTKLEGACIESSNLEVARLGDAVWGNCKIGEEKNGDFGQAAVIYRRLKQWHTNAGIADKAARFYYREKEAARKGAKRRRDRVAGWLSWAFFGHGEGWKRILIWIAGFILAFTFVYLAIDTLFPNWGMLKPDTFLDSLYYSAVSFVLLGYGSWVKEATGLVKIGGVLEAFLGFFMMTLLLVTFVRKWTR
jgi:uncharacterized protein YjbI with pentapeptide repeats